MVVQWLFAACHVGRKKGEMAGVSVMLQFVTDFLGKSDCFDQGCFPGKRDAGTLKRGKKETHNSSSLFP